MSDCLVVMKNHLLNVESGKMKSRYKSEYLVKRKTASGQLQLLRRGHGPLTENQSLVSISLF
jgi:hypothetical protein